jgi:hypothetical protein
MKNSVFKDLEKSFLTMCGNPRMENRLIKNTLTKMRTILRGSASDWAMYASESGAFLSAVPSCSVAVITLLLANGFNPLVRCKKDGDTALHRAVSRYVKVASDQRHTFHELVDARSVVDLIVKWIAETIGEVPLSSIKDYSGRSVCDICLNAPLSKRTELMQTLRMVDAESSGIARQERDFVVEDSGDKRTNLIKKIMQHSDGIKRLLISGKSGTVDDEHDEVEVLFSSGDHGSIRVFKRALRTEIIGRRLHVFDEFESRLFSE